MARRQEVSQRNGLTNLRPCASSVMHRRAWALMVALAALWGASYMFIHIALEDGVSAPRHRLGADRARRAGAEPPRARRARRRLRGRWRSVALLGLVQVAAPFLLITYGQRWIPSSLAAILVAAAPIWVALIAPIMNREEIVRGWAAVGVVVGISASCCCSASTSPARASSRSAARWCCSRPRLRDRRDLGARATSSACRRSSVAAGTMIVAPIATLPPALAAARASATPTWAPRRRCSSSASAAPASPSTSSSG